MYSYSAIEWLFFFYFYCFFGWCFESTYVSIKNRKLVNRGFMRGPFLPLYGSGAIMMLLVSRPFEHHIVLMYLAGCVGATVLEYVTGVTMEALFKVRYWDYSNVPFNFQGQICLSSTLAWGGLTILVTEVVHRQVERVVLSIPAQALTIVTLVLTAYICADFALSFKAAMDLRDILYRMETVKEEMVHLQKRLDVLIALTGEEIANRREAYGELGARKREEWSESIGLRLDEVRQSIEERLDRVREQIGRMKPDAAQELEPDRLRREWADMKEKYMSLTVRHENLSRIKDWIQGNMIRSNPTMYSTYFRDALEELKQRASEYRKGRDEKKEEEP